jgi:hypothetical protein
MAEILLFNEEAACSKELSLTGLDFVILFYSLRFEGLLGKYLLYSFVYQKQLYVNLISFLLLRNCNHNQAEEGHASVFHVEDSF